MTEDIRQLRARAEAYLREHPRADKLETAIEGSQLIHELSVYQTELEMQNHQLKLVQDELLDSNVSFNKLFNEAPAGYVVVDAENRIIKANQTFVDYMDKPIQHILNAPVEQCFEGNNRLLIRAWVTSRKVQSDKVDLELEQKQKTRYLQVTAADIEAWYGKPCKFLVFTDTTELVTANKKSALSAAAINAASEGCFVVDNNQRIVFVNPALLDLLGYQQDEVMGRHPRMFKTANADEDFTKRIWIEISRQRGWSEEIWLADKNGQEIACQIRVNPMSSAMDAEYAYVAMVSDITERIRFQDTILHQATRDALTGLPNRTLLMDRLEQALIQAQRNETVCAVMFMDLDGFKKINDSLGHNVGDTLLVQVAQRLLNVTRDSDTVARMGGDEFIFVLSDVSRDDIASLCDKILSSLSPSFELAGEQHDLTASLGVALYPEHTLIESELLMLADKAMYEAKRQGKAQHAIAHSELTGN